MMKGSNRKLTLPDFNNPEGNGSRVNTFDITPHLVGLPESSKQEIQDMIEEQLKHYKSLEEMYSTDTNQLKYENERLKAQCKKMEVDFDYTKARLDSVSKSLDECTKRYMAESESQERSIMNLKQQYDTKYLEVYGLNEFIRKIQGEKQVKLDQIKDLQMQLINVAESNRMLETEELTLRRIIKAKDDELAIEKSMSKAVEDYVHEVKVLKEQNHILSETTKDLQKELEFVTLNYKELQQNFTHYREQAAEKENTMQAALNKMNDSSSILSCSSIKAQERTRIRRTNTLVHNITDGLPKDSSSRLMSKIAGLEEEIAIYREEIDKLNKNLNYSKKIVEEKNHFIENLELKMKSQIITETENAKIELNSHIYNCVECIDSNANELIDLLKCEVCDNRNGQTFMFWPCDHILCQKCLNFEEFCTKCGVTSRIIKIELIKILSSKFQKQVKCIQELKKNLKEVR